MKTPRELLFEQHRSASPKLDAIRRDVLAMDKRQTCRNSWSLRDFLWSTRWHLAGMSAIWVCIIFLHISSNHGPQMMVIVPPVKRASPQVVLASLRENRRQIAEMIGNPAPGADKQKKFLPKPRSELRNQAALV